MDAGRANMQFSTMQGEILTLEGANGQNDQPGPARACRCGTSLFYNKICDDSFDRKGPTLMIDPSLGRDAFSLALSLDAARPCIQSMM